MTTRRRFRTDPGVRESNAGDDFHILWAARRALDLLKPHSGLTKIVMEGVDPLDQGDGDEEDLLLGVDLSEYHGGDSLEMSTALVVSQLKYSTRHPTTAWTASRLAAGGPRAVIKRLAQVYKHFLQRYPRSEVLQKLCIKLVSNQPASDTLRAALLEGQEALSRQPGSTETAALLGALGEGARRELEALRGSAGASSTEFTDFLRIFDVDECGAEARGFQRIRLIQELSLSVADTPTNALRGLYDLVRSEAQPERVNSAGLEKADILAALGVTDADFLFPSPARFSPVPSFIPTPDARELARTVQQATSRRIMAHGDAGVGKTTTVQALKDHLPAGSTVILYDCFGGGSYLDMGEQRHTHKRALRQLINELALYCDAPFLVQADQEVPDLQRRLSRALAYASKLVAAEGGLLVLAIDAADNAVIAARQAAESERDPFVHALWTVSLPDNCRRLMTSRTHRRDTLTPPEDVAEHELRGFDETASAVNLTGSFPEATGTERAAFHNRTNGNPRVQFYLLEQASRSSASLEAVLDDARRTPEGIFGTAYEAAVRHWMRPEEGERYLALLISLLRPVPLTVLSEVCGVGLEEARRFCRALAPGLILDDDSASFLDEDFETYLRDRLTDAALASAQEVLGRYFLVHADRDEYAARTVAEHLFQASRHDDVVRLALEGPEPAVVRDEMLRLQVRRRRIALALRTAAAGDRQDEALRLTLLAAEAARSNSALKELLRKRPELAFRYGDPRTVARLYAQEETWHGSVHFRTAALHACDPEQHDRADEQLRMAWAWVRRRETLPENETHNWRLDAEDAASSVIATFYLKGPEEAKKLLKRWRPRGFIFKVLPHVATALAPQIDLAELEDQLSLDQELPWGGAAFVTALWKAGWTPTPALVQCAASRLEQYVQRNKKRPAEESLGWALAFCELATLSGVAYSSVAYLVGTLCPAMPDFVPSTGMESGYYDSPLRAVCLKAALEDTTPVLDDLIPEKYRKKEDPGGYDRYESERRRFREHVGELLQLYILRAQSFVKPHKLEDIEGQVRLDLERREDRSNQRWFKFDGSYSLWAERVCDVLVRCEGDAEPLLEEIADAASRTRQGGAPWLWIKLGEKLLPHAAYRATGFALTERAAQYLEERPYPGRDRWEALLECARVTQPYDEGLSRDLYRRSLTAAEGIDDDSALLLSAQAHFASTLAPDLPRGRGRELAVRLARVIEAHERFVSAKSVLPWEEVLGAATRLDPAVGFALCSRWDDEDRVDLADGVLPVVRASAERGTLSPLEHLGFLRLVGEHFDVSSDAIVVLSSLLTSSSRDRPRLNRAMQTVSHWIRRDVPLRQRKAAADRVLAWTEANRQGTLEGVQELRKMSSFVDTFPPDPERAERLNLRQKQNQEAGATVQAFLDSARRGDLEDLDEAVRQLRCLTYDSTVDRYLAVLARSLAPSRRIDYLNMLTAMTEDAIENRIRMPAVLAALASALKAWRNSPSIREWALDGIGTFLKRHLPAVMAYGYNAEAQLEAVLTLPFAVAASRASLLLPAVVEHLDSLSPDALYVLARSLSRSTAGPDLRGALDWSFARTESQLGLSGWTPPNTALPDKVPEVLATFLFSLFGHYDKRVRWRALHAARYLINLPNEALLGELVRLADAESAGAFRSSHLEFYWMSARVWLFLLLERLADEQPALLLRHVDSLKRHALSTSFPHAQVRELAKRAVLRLAQEDPSRLSAEEVGQLRQSNTPLACRYPYESPYDHGGDDRDFSREERRYTFDSMDTMPYWFAPLGRVFHQTAQEVAWRAERWVVDCWARADGSWWDDPRELRDERNAMLALTRHGHIPVLENLQRYLEFHAMQCVAGELIDALPISTSPEEGSWDPWAD